MRARIHAFPYRFATSLLVFGLTAVGCGEKAAQQPLTNNTKKCNSGLKLSSKSTSSTNCNDDDDSTTKGGTTKGTTTKGGTSSGGDGTDGGTTTGGSGSAALFDICGAASGNQDISATGLLSKVCPLDNGSQYTGGNQASVNPAGNIAGGLLTVEVKTSSNLATTIADWWALMQLQLKDTPTFQTKFPDGYSKTTTLDNRQPNGDVVTYDYSSFRDTSKNADAKIEYCAITKFVTLQDGVAYAQVTHMDKAKLDCAASVTDMHGLILVLKKDSGHTLTYSASTQIFSDSPDHLSEIQTRATNNIKEEQVFTGINAPNANKAH